ncbi:hypothetical protein CCMA1212_004627 [Trichoderma ghanense]|uniref:Uncharacterized protein n=1 Tax=Trichoderma ghanense TaxID=65468 RepID=A0ABY2H8Q4_9HYPO
MEGVPQPDISISYLWWGGLGRNHSSRELPETCFLLPSTKTADMSETTASTGPWFPAMTIWYLAGVSGTAGRIFMPPCARIVHCRSVARAKSATHVTLCRDSLLYAAAHHADTLVVCLVLCRMDWLCLSQDAGTTDPHVPSEVVDGIPDWCLWI